MKSTFVEGDEMPAAMSHARRVLVAAVGFAKPELLAAHVLCRRRQSPFDNDRDRSSNIVNE